MTRVNNLHRFINANVLDSCVLNLTELPNYVLFKVAVQRKLVEKYIMEFSLKRHIAAAILDGTTTRDATMMSLSLWLHEPYL